MKKCVICSYFNDFTIFRVQTNLTELQCADSVIKQRDGNIVVSRKRIVILCLHL